MSSNQRPRGRFSGGRPFQQQPRPPQRNQSLDSNGPNLKIRGSAYQIFERYVALAREAATSGDRVGAENFYQHAEHYFRISKENRDGSQHAPPPQSNTPADVEMNRSGPASGEAAVEGATEVERPQPSWGERCHAYRGALDPLTNPPAGLAPQRTVGTVQRVY
jgi:Domain of unknown function (DUF4167)